MKKAKKKEKEKFTVTLRYTLVETFEVVAPSEEEAEAAAFEVAKWMPSAECVDYDATHVRSGWDSER